MEWTLIVALLVIGGLVVAFAVFVVTFFQLWLVALLSGAYVSLVHLVAMRVRGTKPALIVEPYIMLTKARAPVSLAVLETHHMAGGNVLQTTQAYIVAHKAGLDRSFQQCADLDLAGRNPLETIRAEAHAGLQ